MEKEKIINENNIKIHSYEDKIKEINEGINEDILKKDKIINENKEKIEESNKILEEKTNLINNYKNIIDNNLIDEQIEEIRKTKNTIRIIYENNKGKEEINIFGKEFVSNNKNNCKIIYNKEEIELQEKFNVKEIKLLEIQLKGILNITTMKGMFSE